MDEAYPSPILLGAVVGTQVVAALIVGLGVYADAIAWAVLGEEAKLLAYRLVKPARARA